jgi:pyrimidine deaminase RibD-like protein
MRPVVRSRFRKLLVLTLALGACSGKVGGGSNLTGTSAGTGAGAGTGTGGAIGTVGTAGAGQSGGSIGTGAGGDGALASCPTTAITPTPLRRLTKFEYTNSVRNLLGVDTTPVNDLPADEVTEGFNNNAGVLTVSSLHAEKYVLVSEALAKSAVKNLSTLAPCNTATKTEDACALDFANAFGRRVFRRAVTDQDRQILMAAYSAGRTGGSYSEGIEVMVRAALQSAHFLYRLETTAPASATAQLVPLSQYELAARLSFLIWGAGPDDALLDAAGRGDLADKTAVATKARAMLADPKARVAITDFYNQWIGTSRLDITSKAAAQFPAYSDAVRDAMKAETPAFVQYVLWTGDHKLSTLLTSPAAFVSSALAPIYGVSVSSTTPQMTTLPAAQGRSGILTQASFLAVQAHPDQTSPVLRGKFVRTKLMCQTVPPPPMDVDITPPAVTTAATARDRFTAHEMAGSSCNGCHQLMDPIGFAFESFDAVGQYRTTENGAMINLSGNVAAAADPALNGTFMGVRELATKLAGSDQVRDCVATQWFRYAAGRTEEVPDGCSLTNLQDAFGASGGDLADLVVAMTQTDAFWYRAPYTQ